MSSTTLTGCISSWLPIADNFSTMRKAAARGDVYMTVGCMTRHVAMAAQVLFALNERHFVTDKGTLEQIETFAHQPTRFSATVRDVLACPGQRPEELAASVGEVGRLYRELHALCRVRAPELFEDAAAAEDAGNE